MYENNAKCFVVFTPILCSATWRRVSNKMPALLVKYSKNFNPIIHPMHLHTDREKIEMKKQA